MHISRKILAVTTAITMLAVGPFAGGALAKGGAPAAPASSSGGSSKVTLPASFPSAQVPLPAGKLWGVSDRTTSWSIGITAQATYPDAMASTDSLYLDAGFTRVGDATLHQFAGNGYTVQFVGENRDHSATSTNLTIIVSQQ